VRISDVAAEKRRNTRQETPESDSDVPDDGDDTVADSLPKTQYEMIRDQDYGHLDHEAADDLRARQQLEKQFSQVGSVPDENRVADNGVIESVVCNNFMCHTRLVVELGPLLNFIVGENGSGKSAVLTAITLCLGAKASSTNRGGSLKDLIKEGQDHCSIMVKLKNQGESAYQPDVFGESITVERHFSRSGSSGFKLKSTNGRIISTKKRDVDEMVEYFCLQMDNPLNVLSQDNARQFLNASTPSLKYKYFVQGVQLEALDNDYKLVMDTAEQIELKLEGAMRHVQDLRGKYEDAEQLKDLVMKNQEMRDKKRLYGRQVVWVQVVNAEREAAGYDDKVADAVKRIEDAEEKVAKLREVRNGQEIKVTSAKEALQMVKEEMDALREAESAKKEGYDAATEELRKLRQDHRMAKGRLEKATDEKRRVEKEIGDEERRLAESTGDARAEKERQLKTATEKVETLEKDKSQNKDVLGSLTDQVQAAETASNQRKTAVDSKKTYIRSTEQHLREAKQRGTSACQGLDTRTDDLLRLIDRAGGWDHKPIGPIGRLVTLLKPEWTTPVERHLGTSLHAYIVRSHRDQQRLGDLAKKAGVRFFSVLISKGAKLDLQGKEPDAEYETMLRVLKFDNDVVRDQLIIHHSIEQTLLVKERRKAEDILWNIKPRGLRFAYCHHDTKGDEFHALAQGNRIDPCTQPRDWKPRLRTDDVAQVQHLERRLADQRDELRGLQAQWQEAAKKLADARAAVTAAQREKSTLESQLRHAKALVTTIEGEMDQFENDDSRLHMLKDQLIKAQEKYTHEASQLAHMKDNISSVNKKVEALKLEKKEESDKVKEFGKEVEAATKKVKQREDTEKMCVKDLNNMEEDLDLAREAKRRLEEERTVKQEAAKSLEEEAKQISHERVHIPEGATVESIQQKYSVVSAQLKKFEQRVGMTDVEVLAKARTTMEAYERARGEVEGQKRLLIDLKNSLEERLNRWRLFQRFLGARTRQNFYYLLSERAMRGDMRIDHRTKRLSLLVEPDETQRNAKGRQTKTLSGGEKSYASICMLLAIWEAMGSSIRCLDEFDVFMDNVNRAIATNMLVGFSSPSPSLHLRNIMLTQPSQISAARRSVSRQYILITPNAIEGRVAELGSDVKIIR